MYHVMFNEMRKLPCTVYCIMNVVYNQLQKCIKMQRTMRSNEMSCDVRVHLPAMQPTWGRPTVAHWEHLITARKTATTLLCSTNSGYSQDKNKHIIKYRLVYQWPSYQQIMATSTCALIHSTRRWSNNIITHSALIDR